MHTKPFTGFCMKQGHTFFLDHVRYMSMWTGGLLFFNISAVR